MKFSTIGSHGLGDTLLSLKCAKVIESKGYLVDRFAAVREEIFEPLQYLCPSLKKLEENIDYDSFPFKENYSNYYYILPDLLFNNKGAFDYRLFDSRPSSIQSIRLFEDQWKPTNIIFCSLNTTTSYYKISNIREILKRVAVLNPKYEIFFNNITNWNDTSINNGDLTGLPSNVTIGDNLTFIDCLDILKNSCYCLTLDNGIFHIAHSFGVEILLLDTRLSIKDLMFRARWRYREDDSIPANTDSLSIAKLVQTNLEIPATTLIPRKTVLDNLDTDWKQLLLIKE